MSVQVKALVRKIEKDQKIDRLEEAFEKYDHFKLPIKALQNEIETAHKLRPIRTLKPHGPEFVNRVIDALLSDQATRSRLAEISLQAFRAEKTLETAISALKDHLIVTYSADLSMFKTKEERLRIIDLVLARYTTYQDKVITIQNMTNIIIKDIDQAAWSLKATIEALKMVGKPEAMI